MTLKVDTSSGFRTRVAKLQQEISKKKKELAKWRALEARTIKTWVAGNNGFKKVVGQLTELTVHHTKKEDGLKRKIKQWTSIDCDRLTVVRDELTGTPNLRHIFRED